MLLKLCLKMACVFKGVFLMNFNEIGLFWIHFGHFLDTRFKSVGRYKLDTFCVIVPFLVPKVANQHKRERPSSFAFFSATWLLHDAPQISPSLKGRRIYKYPTGMAVTSSVIGRWVFAKQITAPGPRFNWRVSSTLNALMSILSGLDFFLISTG